VLHSVVFGSDSVAKVSTYQRDHSNPRVDPATGDPTFAWANPKSSQHYDSKAFG
jgi:hypothetical protein